MHLAVPTASTDPEPALSPARRAVLMAKARELEAGFLSEMLSHAGLGAAEGAFSGGIGEDQFASFLRDQQARALVEHGGIGLAEHHGGAFAGKRRGQRRPVEIGA